MAVIWKDLPATKWIIVPDQYQLVLVAYGWDLTQETIVRATCNKRGITCILASYASLNQLTLAFMEASQGKSTRVDWEARGGQSHWEISPLRKEVSA